MENRRLQRLLPASDTIPFWEKLLSGGVALVAMAGVLYVSDCFLGRSGLPLVVASMGASAVLLFAVPQGPLSQPWSLSRWWTGSGSWLVSGARSHPTSGS